MADILETVMLICFGCSWPLNLYKNINAHSAKGMSLPFIILITLGYIAGILAKILSNEINYVLIVYIINLIMVITNIYIYVHNYRLDKAKNI